ncbi:MAG: DNA repair protein RecO [Acetobacteraceae bacterium]|nr:DNA repair protein RecO [Acetobacteraceae bacterium]
MEWEAPAVVLDARAYGESSALVSLLTEEHGVYRALARGGGSRAQASLWQRGNLVQARWVARLPDQLGNVSAELIHAGAAAAMDDPLPLAILACACAIADGALPEREPHPLAFLGLVQIVAALPSIEDALPLLIRWEATLLAELGYGLDLSACAITGATTGLAFVSPRTGRAVAREAAGVWESRLLRLPGFLVGANSAGPGDWRDGLALTAHFLARDAFGQQHRPLPAARDALYGLVLALPDV